LEAVLHLQTGCWQHHHHFVTHSSHSSNYAGSIVIIAHSLCNMLQLHKTCHCVMSCFFMCLQELWCCALAAANPSSSSSSSAAAASQVLGQLLVPGQLCLSSLVAALAYHGAQMSEAEAAAASLSQLQVRDVIICVMSLQSSQVIRL
jgi:hypothetical protein